MDCGKPIKLTVITADCGKWFAPFGSTLGVDPRIAPIAFDGAPSPRTVLFDSER